MKVIVIGAGASGIVAAIKASSYNEVILLDGNNNIGKKLLLTGNGKCNYWNKSISKEKYISNDLDILESIISKNNLNKTFNFLTELGIYPIIKDDLYYPYSNSSMSILEILKKKLQEVGVIFINNFKVNNVKKEDNIFKIYGENDSYIEGDKVIIATGGKSMPKTGSDGSIFNILKNMGHDIEKITPGLNRLITTESLKEIENIRANGTISLIVSQKEIFKDKGEIHFTDKGLSGIVSFNTSLFSNYYLSQKEDVSINVDLLSDIENLSWWLDNRDELLHHPTLETLFESVFNYKLMFYIFASAKVSKNSKWIDLSNEEKERLIKSIKCKNYNLILNDDFLNSQVTIGGISLKDINEFTFESKKVNGLYIIGEALDVAGICGGFNLAFAFVSGYLAGDIHD